jgi:hypothetical protein
MGPAQRQRPNLLRGRLGYSSVELQALFQS